MRPLTITSTTHATALSTYAVLALLGGMWSTDNTAASHLLALTGATFVGVWALAVTLSGLAALVCALITPHLPIPRGSLLCEGIACCILTVCIAIYAWSIYGINAHATMLLCGCLGVGCGWRAGQVARELQRIRAALAEPVQVETLAERED